MSLSLDLARQKRAKLDAFVVANNLTLRSFRISGKDLLLVDLLSAGEVPLQRLEKFVERHIATVASQRAIGGACLFIAGDAISKIGASGVVGTRDNEERFAGFVNHYINYDRLPDSTLIGVDLTASHNIAEGCGGLDVLAIRASSVGDLCLKLGGLYGGTWQDAKDMSW